MPQWIHVLQQALVVKCPLVTTARVESTCQGVLLAQGVSEIRPVLTQWSLSQTLTPTVFVRMVPFLQFLPWCIRGQP
jgi:hypothetical protein